MSNHSCGCCEGTEPLTPLSTVNRPGLDALQYRVGTHATFFETMLARLSGHRLDDGRRPLQDLTTRSRDDPAIALLDAGATVADVLTFYQERVANEGYLLTASERRSVLELARLVGYTLRPGVAASVYLAFTLDHEFDIEIPAGTRARSLPGPDELPQVFETDEPLHARTAWNALTPRMTRPTVLQSFGFEGTRSLFLQGTATGLEVNDVLLFTCEPEAQAYAVRAVETDAAADRTLIVYAWYGARFSGARSGDGSETAERRSEITGTEPADALARLSAVVEALKKDPSLPPASRFQLPRSAGQTYGAAADLGPQLLTRLYPGLEDTLYAAYANAPVTGVTREDLCRVAAMRVRAAPFGHNAPQQVSVASDIGGVARREWPLAETAGEVVSEEQLRTLSLDAVYEAIAPQDYVLVDRTDTGAILAKVEMVRTVSRADYGMSARVTELVLDRPWLSEDDDTLDVSRGTTVYAQTEALELAEEPIEEDVAGDEIELDGLYDGLVAGRWLLVSGERTDVRDADENLVEGIEASELVMLAGIQQDVHTVPDDQGNEVQLPSDTLHTRLLLAEPLAYTYRRDTVAINANVVKATHGETQRETLGSGDATKAFQRFTLSQAPLTFVAAPTPDGVESTLEVRVNDVRWPSQETLLYLDGDERGYEPETDDDGRTIVTFGDGKRGARLPTAVDNVTAAYRSGIGKSGNVAAGQISGLVTRPLGVKEVVNPQRASGGADPESRDQARRNVPVAVLALDRLVSVQDYADFARTFAGVGKAHAASLTDGRREIVHLTIAGADDVPIDLSSDLYRNLLLALRRFGDPNVPVQVALREAVFLFVSARVRVLEEYLWEDVEPNIRKALLEAFGFDRRELGQDVLLGEAISIVQGIEGVDYVDVDLLDGVSETDAADPATLAAKLDALAAASGTAPPSKGTCEAEAQPKQRLAVELARVDPAVTDPARRIRLAQISDLSPDLPDTLILTEATS